MTDRIDDRQVQGNILLERQAREKRATDAIQKILDVENCKLETAMVLRTGQFVPEIKFVAKD